MKNFIFVLLAMIKKELLQVLMDKSTRIVLIVPPMIQSVIFGYAATFDINEVPFAFVDYDRSELSFDIRQMLKSSLYFREVATSGSEEELMELLNGEDILLIVKIPSDFSKRYYNGETAQIQILTDGRNSTTAGTSLNYVAFMIAGYSRDHLSYPSLDIQVRYLYNENLYTRWNILPSLLAVLSLIQTMMLSGLSVAREREKGTFDQLLVAPLNSTQLLIGKCIPPMMIGILQSMIIFSVTFFWFKIPFQGNFFSLLVILLFFTFSVVGIGLAISALSQNMQQAMLYVFVLLVPMALLSGLMTPVENMPQFMQYATMINPLRYAISACRRIYLEGISVWDIYQYLFFFGGMALITFSAAAWLFRNKLA
ncbi:MAG: ABC transporter permease [Succinivibrionaceae bacterium]